MPACPHCGETGVLAVELFDDAAIALEDDVLPVLVECDAGHAYSVELRVEEVRE